MPGSETVKLNTGKLKQQFERIDLVARVTDWIRGEILSGKLAPGAKLPSEGNLAAEFGVSRNVIREAMRNLRSMGLVEISQGRAPRVKASDPETAVIALESLLRDSDNRLIHLTEVRYALEAGIVRLACLRRTPEQLQRLRDCLEALKHAHSQNLQIEKDFEFHRILAEATANPVYVFTYETLSGLIRKSQQTTYPHGDGLTHAISGHTAILDAVEKRDCELAGQAMQSHLRDAELGLLNNIKSHNNTTRNKK